MAGTALDLGGRSPALSDKTAGGASTAPRRVAIIMDGNGRWATQRGWPRLVGHRRGAERVKQIVHAAPDLGIDWLTLYAFSTENWKRSTEEVLGLMGLFARYIEYEAVTMAREGVRLRFIGERSRLNPRLKRLMDSIEERTAGNTRLNLTIAINYGGRDELARAAMRLAEKVARGEVVSATEADLEDCLDTAGHPDPDLVIRTSGEMRTSNFLPFQAAYAEYEFSPVMWPDFTAEHLEAVLARTSSRARRFGAA